MAILINHNQDLALKTFLLRLGEPLSDVLNQSALMKHYDLSLRTIIFIIFKQQVIEILNHQHQPTTCRQKNSIHNRNFKSINFPPDYQRQNLYQSQRNAPIFQPNF